MINEERVILMTRLASYEANEGKKDISIVNYFRGDYIGFQVLKSIIAATISFFALFAVYIFYNFEELMQDFEGACYGQYFLEMADYYTRENVDGGGMLLLIYQSLRAILKPRIPNELVRRVFELKAMVVNGEYTERPPVKVSDSAGYTWEYVVASPVEKLYTFVVTDSVLEEFGRCVDQNKGRYIDREFHSLEILKALTARDKRGKTAGETV